MRELPGLVRDDGYWSLYCRLMLGGYVPPTKAVDVFYFGNEPAMASRLAHLAIKGTKRATSGSLAVFEKLNLPVPVAGLISIVTDGFGSALGSVQTE